MAMDNVRNKAEMRQTFCNCEIEEDEPLRIVFVAVQSIAIKILFIVDQVINNAVDFGAKQAAILIPPSEAERERMNRLEPLYE
ncbi:hypothetical protein D3C84_1194980 [compost metagenome]